MNFILPELLNSSSLAQLGGKGAALARLGAMGFEVPGWFGVSNDSEWSGDELMTALRELGTGRFAVRSSGMMEDGAAHSFAGQFESHLEVEAADVGRKIHEVRASAASESVLAYCRERGLPTPGPPTVLVQRMIEPRCAGVAFSADPVSGRRSVVLVSAVQGTGEKLVAGEVDGATWRVGQSGGIVERPQDIILTDDEVVAIAGLARRCGVACGRPQDIEWALDASGKLWLLQSRPITTLGHLPDPDDTLRVWDNSNIAESYGGVTTPLTFSFARRIYDSVYREFCALMSVPRVRIARSEDVFPQMLGLIRGRVYYNLSNWYRVLALLPGFRLNRAFMEQMMGVREPLPDEIVQQIMAENRGSRLADGMALVRTCTGLVQRWCGLRGQIRRFQARLDTALAALPVPLSAMSGGQLIAHYRDLERQLLKKWDAPLVNDFFAMVFYGVLRSLCGKWAGDKDGTLQNELLLDCGEIISAEPPRRIIAMARLAATVAGLPELLADPGIQPNKKIAVLGRTPDLASAFAAYLAVFGDRCLEELKLESPTVGDDPSSLLISIGVMARREGGGGSVPDTQERILTRERAGDSMGPLKRRVFWWVLEQARERVCARENLRFERTRLFGRVRSILRELGKCLVADGILETEQDVFYLELGEILAAWDATATTSGLGKLAQQRRAEFAHYQATPAPPDRFATRGPLSRHARFEAAGPVSNIESSLTGVGACPGRVTGRVRVVLDPRGARLEPGEILVARQTDPGWVVLFPSAAGLLVERGSLLSHSAIVARELRLPCIVSLSGITTTLKTGDLIEMDGAAGVVRLILDACDENPHDAQENVNEHDH